MHDAIAQMREEQNRDRRLATVMDAESELTAARAALNQCTWREPLRRVMARRAVAEAEAARAKVVVPPEQLGSIASKLIQLRLMNLRRVGGRYGSHRHPLHPEVDPYFDQLVDDVAAEVAASADQPGALPSSALGPRPLDRRRASELPELQELLTAPAVRAALTRQRDRARAVAADREMFTQKRSDGLLTAQHAASGLRAEFAPIDTFGARGVGRFGSIMAKHYRIRSIDPSGAGEHSDYFEGLGIGEMVYLHGAAQYCDVRWSGGMLSSAARGLRRRLHVADPYIWDGPCDLCAEHFQDGPEWFQP